jgi:UTP-glucose-1-phosphate uridylyltransferase
MLPILTKPLIQYAVEEAMSAGICNMTIIKKYLVWRFPHLQF